jgi:hypothetical protein
MDRISAPEPLPEISVRRRHIPFAEDVCPWHKIRR